MLGDRGKTQHSTLRQSSS